MPWKHNDYPPSMKNLDKRTRDKAVDIANALLEDGYEEGRAIATAQAEKWADDHPDHRREAKDDGKRDNDSRKAGRQNRIYA